MHGCMYLCTSELVDSRPTRFMCDLQKKKKDIECTIISGHGDTGGVVKKMLVLAVVIGLVIPVVVVVVCNSKLGEIGLCD